jgi:hypothetical protein
MSAPSRSNHRILLGGFVVALVVVVAIGALYLARRGDDTGADVETSYTDLQVSIDGQPIDGASISKSIEGAASLTGAPADSKETVDLAISNLVVPSLLIAHGREIGPAPSEDELAQMARESLAEGFIGDMTIPPEPTDDTVTPPTNSPETVAQKLSDPLLRERYERLLLQSRGLRDVLGGRPMGDPEGSALLTAWLEEQVDVRRVVVTVNGQEMASEVIVATAMRPSATEVGGR